MRSADTYTDKEILERIGQSLRKARTEKGMLQSELAKESGLSSFSISQIENGRNTSLQSVLSILRATESLDVLDKVLQDNTMPRLAGYGEIPDSALILSDSSVCMDWTAFDAIARERKVSRSALLKDVIDSFVSSCRKEMVVTGIMKYKGVASSISDEDIDNDLRLRRMFAR